MLELLATLAVFRLTYMITNEDGPYEVFYTLREKLHDARWIDIKCFYCMSVWVALAFSLFLTHNIVTLVITWLALSGGAIIIFWLKELLERLSNG